MGDQQGHDSRAEVGVQRPGLRLPLHGRPKHALHAEQAKASKGADGVRGLEQGSLLHEREHEASLAPEEEKESHAGHQLGVELPGELATESLLVPLTSPDLETEVRSIPAHREEHDGHVDGVEPVDHELRGRQEVDDGDSHGVEVRGQGIHKSVRANQRGRGREPATNEGRARLQGILLSGLISARSAGDDGARRALRSHRKRRRPRDSGRGRGEGRRSCSTLRKNSHRWCWLSCVIRARHARTSASRSRSDLSDFAPWLILRPSLRWILGEFYCNARHPRRGAVPPVFPPSSSSPGVYGFIEEEKK